MIIHNNSQNPAHDQLVDAILCLENPAAYEIHLIISNSATKDIQTLLNAKRNKKKLAIYYHEPKSLKNRYKTTKINKWLRTTLEWVYMNLVCYFADEIYVDNWRSQQAIPIALRRKSKIKPLIFKEKENKRFVTSGRKKIGFAGRLDEARNIPLIMQIAKSHNFHILTSKNLIGDIPGVVIETKVFTDEEKNHFNEGLDIIYAYTSTKINQSGILLEALHCNKPIITSKNDYYYNDLNFLGLLAGIEPITHANELLTDYTHDPRKTECAVNKYLAERRNKWRET